jgi:hypothetical protein
MSTSELRETTYNKRNQDTGSDWRDKINMTKSRLYTRFKVYLENEFLKEVIIENNCCTPEEFERGEKFAERTAKFLIKEVQKMFIRKKIRNKVYGLYLKGVSLNYIQTQTNLGMEDIDEIIDYMNEIYN